MDYLTLLDDKNIILINKYGECFKGGRLSHSDCILINYCKEITTIEIIIFEHNYIKIIKDFSEEDEIQTYIGNTYTRSRTVTWIRDYNFYLFHRYVSYLDYNSLYENCKTFYTYPGLKISIYGM